MNHQGSEQMPGVTQYGPESNISGCLLQFLLGQFGEYAIGSTNNPIIGIIIH